MRKLFLALALIFCASPALAQNPQCPTRPQGDSSNACASTAFVHSAVGSAIINVKTFGAQVCTGDDAIDDSIAINAGVVYVNSIGGGQLYFPAGTDCRIKNPIVPLSGVILAGQGGLIPVPAESSVIRPSVNMTALILQSDLATPLGNFGLVGMSLDGRKADGFTVTNIVRVSAFGSQIRNSWIANGSGNCVRWDSNASFAWINHIEGNSIGGCNGYGMLWSGTDSWISNNEFGGSALANVKIVSAGANVFSINKFETSTGSGVGLIIHTPDTGDSNCVISNNVVASVYTSNIFEMNGTGIKYEKGTCAGSVKISDINTSNVFIQSATCDVNIESGIINGHLGPNNHQISGAATAYICFAMAGTNTGWKFEGVTGLATLVSNTPADLEYDVHGDQFIYKRSSTGVFGGSLQADHFVATAATQGYQWGSWTLYESAGTAIFYNGTNRFFISATGGITNATSTIGAGSAITSSGPGGALTSSAFTANTNSNVASTLVTRDVSGDFAAHDITTNGVSAAAGFSSAGNAGLTVVKTVKGGGAGADCTLSFNGGLLVASTCP